MTDPITEAVAAERRRAVEAVREIVERHEARYREALATRNKASAGSALRDADVARECLAAVEGKR